MKSPMTAAKIEGTEMLAKGCKVHPSHAWHGMDKVYITQIMQLTILVMTISPKSWFLPSSDTLFLFF